MCPKLFQSPHKTVKKHEATRSSKLSEKNSHMQFFLIAAKQMHVVTGFSKSVAGLKCQVGCGTQLRA